MRAFVALLLLLTTTSAPAEEKYAPLPKKIVEAKAVYIENLTENPAVLDAAYLELTSWAKFKIVEDQEEADLILRFMAVSTEGPVVVVPLPGGPLVGGRTTQRFIKLSVLSTEGKELWTVSKPASETKNLKKSGTAKCIQEFRKRFPKPSKESS